MASRLAVTTAMVCTLIFGGSVAPAQANRRPVAVVALSDDPRAEALANVLGTTLVNHDTLGPLELGSMIGALVGEFLDENRDQLASAEGTRVRAEKELANFVFPVAISIAQAGHESLHNVVPSTRAVGLYSELALVVGKAKLGEGKAAEAAMFFGLVHQLTPGRRLDPALNVPQVVTAFEAARTRAGAPGQLLVRGSGRLWIDGVDQGVTSKPFDLPSGLHVVWLTGSDRETVGKPVVVEAGKQTVLAIGDAPASQRLKVQRARVALRNAADPTARAVAMRRLADLLAVHDAILISMPAGKLLAQTWHDRADDGVLPGFSAYRLVESEKPRDLLKPLVPPRVAEGAPPPPPPVDKRWYQRRPVQATIAAGVLGVLVGSVLLARALEDHDVPVARDTGFVPESPP